MHLTEMTLGNGLRSEKDVLKHLFAVDRKQKVVGLTFFLQRPDPRILTCKLSPGAGLMLVHSKDLKFLSRA